MLKNVIIFLFYVFPLRLLFSHPFSFILTFFLYNVRQVEGVVLVREVSGVMVKAGISAVFSFLVAFILLFIPFCGHREGGCHLGDSSFVQRTWCVHQPSVEYKQVLLSQVIHYKQTSYCSCSLSSSATEIH